MKNIHNQNEKKFHYSLRKIGGKGVVSAVIAVGFFFLGTSAVEAADVSSTEAVLLILIKIYKKKLTQQQN